MDTKSLSITCRVKSKSIFISNLVTLIRWHYDVDFTLLIYVTMLCKLVLVMEMLVGFLESMVNDNLLTSKTTF